MNGKGKKTNKKPKPSRSGLNKRDEVGVKQSKGPEHQEPTKYSSFPSNNAVDQDQSHKQFSSSPCQSEKNLNWQHDVGMDYQSTEQMSGAGLVQEQLRAHRSVEASTQMVYDVFTYTIGMLEELEKIESHMRGVPPNSNIFHHRILLNSEQEVMAGIEAELLCLYMLVRNSPEDVFNDKARKDMVGQTLKWLGDRAKYELPGPTVVDWYCKNVLEILLLGAPGEMPRREQRPLNKLNPEQAQKVFTQMSNGMRFGNQQDKEFHTDPTKKAELKPTRDAGKVTLREGVKRLQLNWPKDREMMEALQHYAPDHDVELCGDDSNALATRH